MRRIIDGTAYDTETAELIKMAQDPGDPTDVGVLYRTRHGAFFLWAQYPTPGCNVAVDIFPFTDVAQLDPVTGRRPPLPATENPSRASETFCRQVESFG